MTTQLTEEQLSKDAKLKALHIEIAIWTVLFKTAVERTYCLKGLLGQRIKQWCERHISSGNSLLKEMEKWVGKSPDAIERMEIVSGYYQDVIFEALEAKNKGEMLALMIAYNQGKVTFTKDEEEAV